jgi:hypothetical protein
LLGLLSCDTKNGYETLKGQWLSESNSFMEQGQIRIIFDDAHMTIYSGSDTIVRDYHMPSDSLLETSYQGSESAYIVHLSGDRLRFKEFPPPAKPGKFIEVIETLQFKRSR